MRHRKINNLDEKLEAMNPIMLKDMEALKGRYSECFGRDADLYIEIGSGKGRFITGHASRHPERNYIAIEGLDRVIIRIAEKIEENELTNVRTACCYIKDIRDFFEKDSLSGIYLNFSDPWPKARHAKRRLTYHKYIEGYMDVLKPGGFVEFKTDNDPLFDFTLEELEMMGIEPVECTRDLHRSQYAAENIQTEYEQKFSERGENINYLKIVK